MSKIKIGLIGAGFMGGMHAACYEALMPRGDFLVTAVADPVPERAQKLAEMFGARIYASGEQLIREADVTAADICLPTYLHAQTAELAMRRGLDVFVEKPVCLNEQEADRLLQVQQETKRNVMVGHCIRFWPEYMELKRLASESVYGRLLAGVFRRVSPRPGWAWQNWLHEPDKSGSAALDLHIHDVDFVRYLLGEPDEVKCEPVEIAGANAHIFSLYRYKDAVISLEGGWEFPDSFPFEMAFRVQFEKATATFSSLAEPAMRIYEKSGRVFTPNLAHDGANVKGEAASGGNISSLGGYYNELNAFLDCLSQGRPVVNSTLKDGVDSLRLALRELAAGTAKKGRG